MTDSRIRYDEAMVGADHPTKADTLNRLTLVEHNNDGTHSKLTQVTDPWVDVRAYGAVGDGATDDSTAFQSAATAAAGKTLVIPYTASGYVLNSAVTISSNTKVVGIGWPTLKQGANDVNIFELGNSTGVIIEGIAFDGNGKGVTGGSTVNIAVHSADTSTGKDKNCIVRNNRFNGFYSWCIRFAGPAGGTFSNAVWVVDNAIDSQVDEGIAFYYIKRGFIRGNLITNHAKEAIKVTSAEEISITDNKIYEANTTQGPLINAGTNVDKITITGNYLYQGSIGIGLEKGVTDSVVANNVCEGQGTEGIGVKNTLAGETPNDHIVVKNNVCKAGMGIDVGGISGLNMGAIVIEGNTLEATGNYPNISVVYTDNVVVANNHCKGAGPGKDGIAFSNVTNGIVTGNFIDSPDSHGMDFASCTRLMICNNFIKDPNQNAVPNTYHGINIPSSVTTALTKGNVIAGSGYNTGIVNQATNHVIGSNYVTGQTNNAVKSTGTGRNHDFVAGQLGATNSASATTPGSVAKKIEVFDGNGSSLGFVAVYDAIT